MNPKIEALRSKMGGLIADKKRFGIVVGSIVLVLIIGVVAVKFAHRTPPPPPPRPALPPKPPTPPKVAPAPPPAKPAAAAVAEPTKPPAEDKAARQEELQKKLGEALDACSNEIGIFCNGVKDNDWAAIKCVRQHPDSILPACAGKLDALRHPYDQ